MREQPFVALVARALSLCVLLPFAPALAATDDGEGPEHVAVLELGATGEREISESTSHVGPAVGIELEPIENWLEVELGASTYRSRGATNWLTSRSTLSALQHSGADAGVGAHLDPYDTGR
jgi:hypothetical protein